MSCPWEEQPLLVNFVWNISSRLVWIMTAADVSTITDDPAIRGTQAIGVVPKKATSFPRLLAGRRLIRVVLHRHPSRPSVKARSMDHRCRSHKPFPSNQRLTYQETQDHNRQVSWSGISGVDFRFHQAWYLFICAFSSCARSSTRRPCESVYGPSFKLA